jgi:hypothetical protein
MRGGKANGAGVLETRELAPLSAAVAGAIRSGHRRRAEPNYERSRLEDERRRLRNRR